ncbi:cob(I)yrinic acid a,c-diamide adenosyltransferase [Thiolapillus sp.]
MPRLSRITTRSGDGGQTGLADGSRVDKDSPRIQVLGDLDELNAALGLLMAELEHREQQALITGIQQQLFNLGGELALPGTSTIDAEQVLWLEQRLKQINTALPPLQEFVLPGGSRAAAQAHLARAVCRRAERSLWGLSRQEWVNSESLKYLNRLSDLLFVVARALARQASTAEPTWNKAP